MLRAYGNPKLLRTAQSIYGPDFVPFGESIVIKMPENGAAFAWHQDGTFKTGPVPERGVNFGIYLNSSSLENGCLHLVPGTQRQGRVDIDSLVVEDDHPDGIATGDQPVLSGMIPKPAESGDMIIHSRNLVHGSFPNESTDLRVTVYFGFHALSTVEDVYSDEHIRLRMGAILLAVRARQESGLYPDEETFDYRPRGVPSLTELDRQAILGAASLSI
jgi:ectoine hydroxylase-related dioxygenase (phytanoyl-CoA dioxygenase family)